MRKILIAFSAVFLFFGSANASLIVNGSFEEPTGTSIGTFTTLSSPSNAITGWTVSNGSIDWIGTYWDASEGNRSLDMNGTSPGTISQTFSTTIGSVYKVEFDLAGNPDQSYDKSLIVSVSATGGTPQTHNFPQGSNDKGSMGWLPQTYFFTATNSSTDLSFASNNQSSSWGAALDNVRGNVVPIPSALLLLGSGLIGFIGLRRRLGHK